MSLESVFANPPNLVGLANKESGEEAKERTPFFYDDDEDTQEYDPNLMSSYTHQDQPGSQPPPMEPAPPAEGTPTSGGPSEDAPPPMLEPEPQPMDTDYVSNDQPHPIGDPSQDLHPEKEAEESNSPPRPGKSPSHEGRGTKRRHRSHHSHKGHRRSRRHSHRRSRSPEDDEAAPRLDKMETEASNAEMQQGAVDPEDLEDGELEDGEIDEEVPDDGPPKLSPQVPMKNESESEAEKDDKKDENAPGDQERGQVAGGKKRTKRKGKGSQKKRKKREKKEKARKDRLKYHDHDQINEEDVIGDVGLGYPPGGSPRQRDPNRSPPGPYDSPYDSPPGPYDSPSDEDDYGPPAKMMRKSPKKQSMMSMLSGEYVDTSLSNHEKEEMLQHMRGGGMSASKMKKMEKSRMYKEMQQRQRTEKKNVPPPRQRCKFYMEGKCAKGKSCSFSHDFKPPRKTEVCKFYINNMCAKGKDCVYMHGDYPCKYFHMGQKCLQGEECRFSHDPLDDHTRPIFEKICHEDQDFVTMMITQHKSPNKQEDYNYKGQQRGGFYGGDYGEEYGDEYRGDYGGDYADGYGGPGGMGQGGPPMAHQGPPQAPTDLKKIPSLFDIEVFPPTKPLASAEEDSGGETGDDKEKSGKKGDSAGERTKGGAGKGEEGAGSEAHMESPRQGPMQPSGPHAMGPRGPLPPSMGGPMGGPPPRMMGRGFPPRMPGMMGGPPPRPMGGPPQAMGPRGGMAPIRPPPFYGDMAPQGGPMSGPPPPMTHQPGLLGPPPNMLRPPHMHMPPGMHPMAMGGDPRMPPIRPGLDGAGFYGAPAGSEGSGTHSQDETIQSPEPEPGNQPMPNLDQYQAGLKLGELMGLGGLDDQDEVPANLPPRQRELFLRIQQQQRQNVPDEQQGGNDQQQAVEDDNWYSSDEEESGGAPKSNLASILKTLNQGQAKPQGPQAPSAMPFDIAKVLNVIQSQPPPATSQAPPTSAAGSQGLPSRDPRQAAVVAPATVVPAHRPDPRVRNNTRVDPRSAPRADPRTEQRADPRLRSQPTMPIDQLVTQNTAHLQQERSLPVQEEPELIIHSTSNGNTVPYNIHKMLRSLPSIPPHINPSDPKFKDDPRIQKQLSQGKGALDPRTAKRQTSSNNDPREKSDPRVARTLSGGTSPHQGSRAMDPRMQKGNSTGPSHLIVQRSEASGPLSPRHGDPRMARTTSAPPLSPAVSESSGHPGLPPVLQQPTRTKSDPRQMKALGLPAFNTGPRDSPPMPSLPPFIPPKPTIPLTKQASNHSPNHSPKREDPSATNEPLAHRNDPRFKKKPKADVGSNNSGMSPTSNPDPRQQKKLDSRKTFEHRSPLDAGGKSSSEPSFGSFNRGHNFRQQQQSSQYDSKPGRDNQNQRDRRIESGPTPTLPGPARHLGMPQLGMPTRQISRLLPSTGSQSNQFSPQLGSGSPLGGTPENRSPEDDPDKSVRDVFKTIDPTASPFC